MLNEHDQEVNLRCRRLGHEVAFGYCRQETRGQPCRLILDCWWERFDVRGFLQAHLTEGAMAQVESTGAAPPPAKVLSLVDLIQRAKEGLPSANPDSGEPPKRST